MDNGYYKTVLELHSSTYFDEEGGVWPFAIGHEGKTQDRVRHIKALQSV